MARILVVDDDRAVQEMLVDLLMSHGYEFGTCRDGRAAFEELQGLGYDALLLDVLIPKVNGFTLIEQIRNHPALRELPIIMMSGIYRSRNHRTEMVSRYGILEYFDKPLSTETLIDVLRKRLGGGKQTPSLELARPAEGRPEPPVARLKPMPTNDKLVDSGARAERGLVEEAARNDFSPSAFLEQGTLRTKPVAAVLGSLWHENATGALLLRNQKVKKIVFLRDGTPYHVKSNLVSECLGQLLVRERLISEQDCAASIETMRRENRRQGEVLVSMRCITEKNLKFALELQAETKLYETFVWDDGEYRFNASAELPPATGVPWAGASVIVEGIRRTFDETRLRRLMLPIFDVPLKLRDPRFNWSKIGLQARELAAMEALRLPATTRELVEGLPLDPPDALRLLYSLIALELALPSR